MFAAIFSAVGPFLGTIGDLIAKAAAAKAEQHAQILADMKAAAQKLVDDLAALSGQLSAADAAADAALKARFPHP